jgi:pimeloyl-ACP methyl ester carboxylesterase
MLRKRRLYPERPKQTGLAEASLDWTLQAIVAALGARRAVGRQLKSRIKLSGVPWEDMEPILNRVRGVADWSREWMRYAEVKESEGEYEKAAAAAYLGQLIIALHQPSKRWFWATMQRCHLKARQQKTEWHTEKVSLVGGQIHGLWERPHKVEALPVLLLPPLACAKEELAPLADPLLAQGHPVLRLDLPGQGESIPPLQPDSEAQILTALEEMGIDQCFIGGISLGSFYGLRLTAQIPERVHGVFAVSPPAIQTPDEWARQMEIIWQYLDHYFAAPTREQTYRLAQQLTLEGVGEVINCPVLIYHATLDRINPPTARESYRNLLTNAPLTDFLLPDTHACPYHLRPRIAPEVADWVRRLSVLPPNGQYH